MRRAKAVRKNKLTEAEHPYGEAFKLMTYTCSTCGYSERIWNSRNGVTPFYLKCPQCVDGWQKHVDWWDDETLPGYQPSAGQRVFVGKPDEPTIKVMG